jgi:uncharacterized protein
MPHTAFEIHAFRLQPGQDLKKELEAFVLEYAIEAGWIQTGVGSLTQTYLRFANQPSGTFSNGPFEIVSLVGTLSVHGCHLHISVSDALGHVTGGHLLEGNVVYTTAELVIGVAKSLVFIREKDGTTDWKELQITTLKSE